LARPRSDDKRRAILDAAARVLAERGLVDSPTSAISKAAGVAEGTLFTYFKSKEELFNELYLDYRRRFGERMADLPRRRGARAQLRFIWDTYLTVGTTSPERLRVQSQLRASGKLFKENETPEPAMLQIVNAVRKAAGNSELSQAPAEFLLLLMRAQAEATLEFIAAHPELKKESWETGFQFLWKGIAGK
jgi:AcrR family transcriptional regulator